MSKQEAEMSGIDIGSIKETVEDAWLDLMDEVGTKPLGVRIKLAGLDSEVHRKASRAIQARRMAVSQRGRSSKVTPEMLEDEATNLLCACVLDWEGFKKDGQPWPCTKENVRSLLTNSKLAWVREQIDDFIGDRQNYFQD